MRTKQFAEANRRPRIPSLHNVKDQESVTLAFSRTIRTAPFNQARSGAETAARKGPRECPGSETATRAGRRAYTPRNPPCQCRSQPQKNPSVRRLPGRSRCAKHRITRNGAAHGKPQDLTILAGK